MATKLGITYSSMTIVIEIMRYVKFNKSELTGL